MASYLERPNLNFDMLHKDFDTLLGEIYRNFNQASDFENAQILHNLAH